MVLLNLGSICQRNGYLLLYAKDNEVTWHSGKDTLKVFKFASKKIAHSFCPECGTSIGIRSDTPGFYEGTTVLNVSLVVKNLVSWGTEVQPPVRLHQT
jgi:hypothetical protein